MSFTETIKNYILNDCRMDLVGIAPASVLDDAPAGHRATDILPGAKSLIVFARRITDGAISAAFRKIEDGNLDAQSAYATYGSDLLPNMNLFFMQFNIAEYMERTYGYTTLPVPSGPMHNVTSVNVKLPIFMGPNKTYMILDVDKAAVAAGLGEYAWSNCVVTPEYGPRQQFGMVVTQIELDYDKPYSGEKLCDHEKCGLCARICPTHALSESECCAKSVCGKEYPVGKMNTNSCAVAALAFRKEFAGKAKNNVPDQIMTDAPTDEELAKAYAEKPVQHSGLDHYPKYFCNKCMLYCPLGKWKEHFYDRNLSKFDGNEELIK